MRMQQQRTPWSDPLFRTGKYQPGTRKWSKDARAAAVLTPHALNAGKRRALVAEVDIATGARAVIASKELGG